MIKKIIAFEMNEQMIHNSIITYIGTVQKMCLWVPITSIIQRCIPHQQPSPQLYP